MKRERKRYTSEYKAELALEVVKGQRTLNEIASASGVYEAQLYEEIGRGTPWIQGRVRLAEKMPACLAAGERRQLVE